MPGLTATVPATVANLGPGFDCLGMAIDLTNEISVDLDAEPGVVVEGEGRGELPEDASNLVFRSMAYLAREAGGSLPPFRLASRNRIPLQRGLGSSASAVVGGLLLADRLLGSGLSAERLLEVAVDLEGHADNVAACLIGGLTLAYLSDEGWRTVPLPAHPDLRPILVIPLEERVDTQDARRVLPTHVPRSDASFNLARAALLVVALSERPELLGDALQDRLHQAARLALAPSARALFAELRGAGTPVCVAGSGPTLVAFLEPGAALPDLGPGWRVVPTTPRAAGAAVSESVA